MKATTIKLEGDLLKEVQAAKPTAVSLSGFVRQILHEHLKRRKMAEAATEYQAFVASDAQERKWVGEWTEADLTKAPRTKGARP